jgi:hypothetical protein
MFLIQIALVLLLVGGGLTLLTQGKATKRREALIMRRVDAYIETIRRDRTNPALVAMSDSELRDLLFAGAHNLRAATQKRLWVLLGVGAARMAGVALARRRPLVSSSAMASANIWRAGRGRRWSAMG